MVKYSVFASSELLADSSGHMAVWQFPVYHPPHADHMNEVILTNFPVWIGNMLIHNYVYVNSK